MAPTFAETACESGCLAHESAFRVARDDGPRPNTELFHKGRGSADCGAGAPEVGEDKRPESLLVPGDRVGPPGVDLRLLRRLLHEGPGAPGVDGPGPHQRLIEEVLGVGIGPAAGLPPLGVKLIGQPRTPGTGPAGSGWGQDDLARYPPGVLRPEGLGAVPESDLLSDDRPEAAGLDPPAQLLELPAVRLHDEEP